MPPEIRYSIPYNASGLAETARHRLGVQCLTVLNDTLFSAGRDGRLIVHRLQGTRTPTVVEAHWDWINDMTLINEHKHCNHYTLQFEY